MRRSFAACALPAIAVAFMACGGPSGHDAADAGSVEAAPASPSVSGIVPSQVFLARSAQVTISGYATHWTSATKVDFGPGIAVEDLVAASPTALVARVTTTKSTPIGVRDVVVEDGSSRERYAGAFEVVPPVNATFQGTMAQGALARLTLQVLDTSTPLDLTAVRALDGTITFPDLALTLPPGVSSLGVSDAQDFEVTFVISVDVDASASRGDLDLVSGPSDSTTEFPLPSGVRVTARAAAPLASGVAATGQITSAYDSVLYAFTAPRMAILDFSVTSPPESSPALYPAVALLPSSGHFADLLGFSDQQTAVAPGGMPLYAVCWENTGGTGPYSVAVASTDVGASAATTPADETPQGAIAVSSFPFVLTGGDLSKQSFDYLKVTLSQAATLRVQTVGDLDTDTRIAAYQSDAITLVGPPIDSGYAADARITLSAAGTYYIEFLQGADYAAPHTKYTGIVRVN